MCLFDLDCSAVFSGISKYFGMISPAYDIITCKSIAFPTYYNYWFSFVSENRKFKHYAKNLRYTLKYNEFSRLPIVAPSLSEQQKIAGFLDEKCGAIDEIIVKTEQSVEEYKKLKQSVITEAVTKGVRPNRKMKDSGIEWIGEIPEDWNVKKLRYVAETSRGLFNHRPRNDERYYNGIYPFIQTGDVANASKYITSYSQTLNEFGIQVSKKFPKGTLTMTIAANIGDIAILGFDAYFPDSVLGIIPKKNIDGVYLYYLLKSMKQEFINNSIVNTQLNLNIERTKCIFVPFTDNREEQTEISDYLDEKCSEIDVLIEKKQQFLTELATYKKSLIYEYVTGKKEVV